MAMVHTGGPDGVRLHVQRLGPEQGGPQQDRPGRGGPGRGGAAPTAVLLHGLLTDSLAAYYFTVGPGLAAAGVDVVMYDQRGHGRSERPAGRYRLEMFVGDLERLLDRLGIHGPVHLVGNCFGGTVAFSYAVRHPERVAGLSLIESEPATGAWAAKLDRLLGYAAAQLSEHESDALAWIDAHHGGHTARLARSAARLVRTTSIARDIPSSAVLDEGRIRSVRGPLLALYGADSDMAAQAPWLESLLPGTRTVIVPGHEHSVLVEVPALVLEHVLAHVLDHDRDGDRDGVREPGGRPGGRPRVAALAGLETAP
ncbi:alpha/beta fold hydrolase [Streptomyces sparsogenes]|uniref:Alpha/beta hydrolase fold protein n=1 Tax=Streptomyces sparsogenes DSM 40356 TaxID=1331668 RepID=A0A1R1SDB2_9ACTN|nr:alpha/beta hydrolase [Streptomyces sparsogenes]OMI36019.1 alpha/beta hydrolase fold protein [Streptomyces sparsogenes DSM 40356]